MGQKVNPISNRLGIIRGWDSNWFGGKNFGDNLVEDQKIRKYLNERLAKASVSKIVIERTLKLVTITICTARPGIVIGKGGQDVDKLKEELKKLYNKDIQINIFEIKKPELDATIVANNVARQIEGKIAYRRAIKMAVANTMRAGAEGIKIQISGRLNGAEIARKRVVPRCTLSVPISTTARLRLLPRLVCSVSRCGSAVVRFTRSATSLLTSLRKSRAVVATTAVDVVMAAVVVRETIIVKRKNYHVTAKKSKI